jgi:cullin-associated NEDD8-dissociated protein 1
MQMDVFNTFIELLRQTGNVTKGQIDMDESRQVSVSVKKLTCVNIIRLNFTC